MAETLSNFATSTLNGGIDASTLTIVLVSGTTFPASGTFRLRIDDELISIASRSGATLTATSRAIEGTSPATHSSGADVYGVVTRDGLEAFVQQEAADAVVGGQTTGTVGAITVANTHGASGVTSHATAQSNAEATAASALSSHEADTTSIHGITNTASLETTSGAQTKVDTHVNDTGDAHAASAVSFSPTGSISSTDVQAAIAEVAVEAGATSVVPAYILVASNDMPADVKASGEFVADGTADEVQINQAAVLAGALTARSNSETGGTAQQRGQVLLSGGRFNMRMRSSCSRERI